LDYRNRKVSIDSKNVTEFIRQLADGDYLIPTFQRLFVWDPENITSLWDSMYRGYPIGSIVCWKTRTDLHVHRKLGGFYLPDSDITHRHTKRYILDGQQRATSLVVSFHGGAGKIREQSAFDYTLYFDLTKAQFFFEKDYYKHRWDADAAFLVRLKDALELPDDHGRRHNNNLGSSAAVEKNLAQLKYLFANYSIPIVYLEGFDLESVCTIYERTNQTGIRLKNMDILIARSFKNYSTVVEEDFPIG
jgi:hypothetical protein